jgi:hypothetical protein
VVLGVVTAVGSVLLAALAFVLVLLTATVRGCADAMGVHVSGVRSPPPSADTALLLVSVFAAVGTVTLVVGLLRRLFARRD